MKTVPMVLCAMLAAIALAACEEKIDVPVADAGNAAATDGTTAPGSAGQAANAPPAPSPEAKTVEQVTVDANAVRVGTSVDAGHAATGAKPVYSTADTIHASLAAAGRTGTAKVYWTYQDGMSQKEEEKALSGSNVDFAFSRADGLKPGSYNVEIDVDGVPAGIADFKVK